MPRNPDLYIGYTSSGQTGLTVWAAVGMLHGILQWDTGLASIGYEAGVWGAKIRTSKRFEGPSLGDLLNLCNVPPELKGLALQVLGNPEAAMEAISSRAPGTVVRVGPQHKIWLILESGAVVDHVVLWLETFRGKRVFLTPPSGFKVDVAMIQEASARSGVPVDGVWSLN